MKINMHRYFFSLLVTVIVVSINFYSPIYAQQQNPEYFQEVENDNFKYLGFGIGINDYGFGLGLELPVVNKLTVFANAGVGGWGWKLGGGIQFYPKGGPYRSSYSIGYSHASGSKDFETQLPTVSDPNAIVLLDLNPVGTINLIYSYNVKLGKSNKIVFSGGYAIGLSGKNYVVKTPGAVLTPESEQILDILQPGGLIVGIKFMFSL